MTEGTRPDWGTHLRLVFSVLVSVSFAQAFDTLGRAGFSPSQLLLIGTVFYVVLDNWYVLNRELTYSDVPEGPTVVLYLTALVAYSCLPFLYFSRTAVTSSFGPTEFLVANLSAICFFDALRRTVFVLRVKSKGLTRQERETIGKSYFLLVTGYAYAIFLGCLAAGLNSLGLSDNVAAAGAAGLWLAVRVIDYAVIPKLSLRFYTLVQDGAE